MPTETSPDTSADSNLGTTYDVAVIGAGFAGMYLLHQLRERGFRVHVYETADGVGGTWYWNRYPGARCDVESLYYSYSWSPELQQEWEWTERYPSQPEILRYANHVADRFDLRRDISFETPVASAVLDDERDRWTLTLGSGEEVTASFVVTAVGCLSASREPDFEGRELFAGATYHTGRWPHSGVDLAGQRVGVIGTGSSAIQAIPVIARDAAEVTVFQRTPNYSVPARNHPLDPQEQREVKADYPRLRELARHSAAGVNWDSLGVGALTVEPGEATRELDRRWAEGGAGFMTAFVDTAVDPAANEVTAEYVRQRIAETVDDPATAELLTPRDYPIGTKRICVDTDYFATYNQPHVHLVDVATHPVERLTEHGIVVDGHEHEVDVIVFATGYDAMTGPLNRIDVRGVDGRALKDKWADGPTTYLGIATEGFPNLFMLTGPGSPSVLSNMIVSIEQHVDWVAEHLTYLREHGIRRVEASADAEQAWVAHVNEVAHQTLYPQANSWYMGANIPGKPRVFMPYVGGVGAYREQCDEVAAADYKGFVLQA